MKVQGGGTGLPSPVVTEKKGKSPEQYCYPDDCEH